MKTEGFTPASYESEKQIWLQGCPYAILYFISCVGHATHSRLANLLGRLGVDDIATGRRLVEAITEALLKSGNIYKIGDRVYAPFPPYAVQRDSEEWIILGDSRIDRFLAQSGGLFEVQSNIDKDRAYLERLLLITPDHSSTVFQLAGIRSYTREDMLALVPEVKLLTAPITWPGFEPSAYTKWEALDSNCCWIELQSRTITPEGLCRGSAVDQNSKIIFVRYFFKHQDGWSPLTSDEASLWVLKTAASIGKPYTAEYSESSNCLRLPVRIPYSAYVALRLLGHAIAVEDGTLTAKDVDSHTSRTICEKLAIRLAVRRNQ